MLRILHTEDTEKSRYQARNQRVVQRTQHMYLKPLPIILALIAGALSLALAMHHPLAPQTATGLALAVGAFVCAWPHLWLLLLPALLPVIGLAPWTGWITFEELDILVLAVAAGGYARMAWPRPRSSAGGAQRLHGHSLSVLAWLMLGLFALSTTTALFRGFADAGGFVFGWFQGYHEPMNSVRLAKSFFEALLLLPLWQGLYQQNPERAQNLLSQGLMLGLALAALATVWERAAFTGLLNFSSDYRTTALFWEMHVGGAALDGFLALTVPFALRELVVAKTPMRWGLAAGAMALAAYACLTTFSRGVYLAIPVGLVIYFALKTLQRRQAAAVQQGPASNWFDMLKGALLVAAFTAGTGWMFQTSGYRGAGALLGTAALLLPLAGVLRTLPMGRRLAGGVGGVVLITLAAAVAWLVPKGPYIAYVVGFAFTAWTIWAQRERTMSSARYGPMALAGFMATGAGVVLVAGNWGGPPAIWPAVAASAGCLLLAVVAGVGSRSLWPEGARWQAGLVGTMGVAVVIVGVFAGGAYMGDRFSAGGRDLDARIAHWRLGTTMLQTPADWWLGKGAGRFPANHFLVGDPKEHPGDYRLKHDKGNSYLRLTGGLHLNGWGEIFRVTQRVSEPGTPARASAQVRTAMDIALSFEVCEKHLLYSEHCLTKAVDVKAAPGKWQSVNAELRGDDVSRGAWYAPRLLAFSVAMQKQGGMADLDQLTLSGPDGRNLLANGDFSEEMAHWFFSSDKFHMPWHMKNMFMHVLFDQGVLGLVLWVLLVGGALVHLGVGRAKAHPLAPAVAASLAGFVTVGLFDSLLDVPRLATLFYFLALIGLTLRVQALQDGKLQPHEPRANAPHRVVKPMAVIVLTGLLAAGAAGLVAFSIGLSPMHLARMTPAEWIRHTKLWLADHEVLAAGLQPPLAWLQSTIERTPPAEPLPTLGKGQQAQTLPLQIFKPTGEPVALVPFAGPAQPVLAITSATVTVGSAIELVRAIDNAAAGQVIELAPGRYRINQAITTRRGGTPGLPVTVRAARPGDVQVEFDTVEGFHVTQPYWVFENLAIRGVCQRDADCEHAFHIVGAARGVVLRNNRLEDFNAHIKVNGENNLWPDNGLAQFNTLTNTRPRKTPTPVTPFDLVAASSWQVADNVVTDFVNEGGNRVSYGVFMKGAGTGGRIERNLIVCTSSNISGAGNRIGLSWGGGSTEARSCRDKMCAAEHTGGLAANNVIAHCNDAGIDTNQGRQINLVHNTLINTAGILIRGRSEDVHIDGNLLEGRIRLHDSSIDVVQSMNEVTLLKNILTDADRLKLERKEPAPADMPLNAQVPTDFCQQPRKDKTWAGATGSGRLPCAAPVR